MKADYPDSISLLQSVNTYNLYDKLISQLNKDLRLAGISNEVSEKIAPKQLVSFLRENIYRLLLEDFPGFLNLLYVVDVEERQIRETSDGDAVEMADAATFLLLKRIWKKVWLKEHYK